MQISFDGLRDNHDRRRRYRAGYRRVGDGSSFDQAVALVDQLVGHARVGANADDLPGFISFAVDRGWFDGPFRCKLVVAKLSAYSERSAFMRPHELTPSAFTSCRPQPESCCP